MDIIFSVTEGDVATAEAQVFTTEAQAINALIQRAQFEHAIAMLIDVTNGLILNGNKTDDVVGLSEPAGNLLGVGVYPNPTSSDQVKLSVALSKSEAAQVVFTNSLGQVVLTQTLGTLIQGSQTLTLNVKNLSAGFYQVAVITASGQINTRFVKE